MFSFVPRVLLVLMLTHVTLRQAAAGAFMLPPGTGQFIAGIGYSAGSRSFDQAGQAVPAPSFSKVEASGYLEYGATDWMTLVLAPTLVDAHDGPATNSVTGSDSSALGARFALFSQPGRIVALQALVQPPSANESFADELADGGAHMLATDVRVMIGQTFTLFGWPAFIDIDPGVRFREAPFPDEKRLDATLGLRPSPRLLVLIQDFSSFAGASGMLIPPTSYSKAQGSLVYDISPVWSVQVGAFRTFAGRDIVRETGPLAKLWFRF